MRILVVRLGAFGDNIVITPVVRYLHTKGNTIVLLTNERGSQIFKNNPHIEKLIESKTDEVSINDLSDFIEKIKKENKCERVIDFTESLEVSLALHPRSPEYKLPRSEKLKRFNRNYYEHSYEWADIDWKNESLRPELFFTDDEIDDAKKYLKPGKFNILVGMSGSGTNKVYPWTEALCGTIVKEMGDNVHIITVGDLRCQIIEPIIPSHITNLSGLVPMRTSLVLTSLVDLVISPDTGVLHSAGCFMTPKIGLLGHNTVECITKHFDNDYSIEANPVYAECAPCLFLIYNIKLQCPIDPNTGASYCMSKAIPPELVYERVQLVYRKSTTS